MKNVKQYYRELGKLIYAIAMADGVIQPEEKEKLFTFVLKQLSHYEKESDSSGMNKAFYVDFSFVDALKAKPELNGSVKRFSDFVKQNYEAWDEKLLELSITLMQSVATAYTRKRETAIIDQVRKATSALALKN